ncbi:glycosyltransferase [Streptomyces sp. NBC_01497]|uniref:glycosyltransferase n=1 Tax=Streptomyces sp. NBC_01497 TaxID=2903885 RepID=UPI002E347894|nr:nucleotide disphospho-sugar-binding domain-containing protein [Streptomyces sp. NBC_01497]
MRVMFSGVSLYGHTLPLLPLARAFHRRGDDVVLALPASFMPVFSAEPFRMFAAGADTATVVAEVHRLCGVDLLTAPTPEAEIEALAGTRVDMSVTDLLAAATQWWPELIVHDPYDYAAPLIAAELGVPTVVVTLGPGVSPTFERAAARKVAPRYRARGLTPGPPAHVLDVCPPGLSGGEGAAPSAGRLPMRPEPHHAPDGAATRALSWPSGSPRVLVTFGTAYSGVPVVGPVVRALAGTGAAVRVTVGQDGPSDGFATAPGPVAYEPFAPLVDLLDGADLVVAHGGAGTVLGTLSEALPMVLLPQGADQFTHTERAAGAGAAIGLTGGAATAEATVAAVAELVAEPSYRRAARTVAAEIAAMPSPDEVAATLAGPS